MNSNLKSVMQALIATTILMFLMWALYSSMQPRGEYQKFIVFHGNTEYQTWCDTNDTYIPYLCWNFWQAPNAEVTVWVRYDYWGNPIYTSTGKGIATIGGIGDDNDKTD